VSHVFSYTPYRIATPLCSDVYLVAWTPSNVCSALREGRIQMRFFADPFTVHTSSRGGPTCRQFSFLWQSIQNHTFRITICCYKQACTIPSRSDTETRLSRSTFNTGTQDSYPPFNYDSRQFSPRRSNQAIHNQHLDSRTGRAPYWPPHCHHLIHIQSPTKAKRTATHSRFQHNPHPHTNRRCSRLSRSTLSQHSAQKPRCILATTHIGRCSLRLRCRPNIGSKRSRE